MTGGGRPPFPLDEEQPLVDRVALLERDLVVVRRLLGIRPAHEREDDDHTEADIGGAVDRRTPAVDLRHPAAWRGLSDAEVAARWKDLCVWVDWVIGAYRLPPRPWETWWKSPGVCEELSALRAWHRELVDVAVPAMKHPPEGLDADEEIEWLRGERALRLDLARSHVEWHEALWQLVARVTGMSTEQKPLLARESEATPRTSTLRDAERARRERAFGRWLIDPDAPDENSPDDASSRATTETPTPR